MLIYMNVSGLGPVKVNITCADQGIFIRGGGPDPTAFIFRLFCVILNLFTEGFQWFYFREVLSFSRKSNSLQEQGDGGGSKC